MVLRCGLIKGRHVLPDNISLYVFDSDIPQHYICDSAYMDDICENFLCRHKCDAIEVYVTGFTPALLSLIKLCLSRGIKLSAWNYDRESRSYWKQEVII